MDESAFFTEALRHFVEGNWPAAVGLTLAAIAIGLRGNSVLMHNLSPIVGSVVTVAISAGAQFGQYFVQTSDVEVSLRAAAQAAIFAAVALVFPSLDAPMAQPKALPKGEDV